MNLTFSHFKKLLFESLFNENKNHLIDKLVLPDLQDDPKDRLFSARSNYKNILKAFFYKYPNYENKIDWNKWKTLTKADFDAVIELAKNSKRAQKEKERQSSSVDPKSFFKNINGRRFAIVDEDEDWLYVAPLNYKAAVFCDSQECGGAPAKWCIGYQQENTYWNNYVSNGSKFLMVFSKDFDTMPEKELYTKLKFMIEYTGDRDSSSFNVWNQLDEQNKGIPESLNLEKIDGLFYEEIDWREYALDEVNSRYGDVVYLNVARIKNGIYTPPENAVGIDFGQLEDSSAVFEVKGLFIPKNIKAIRNYSFTLFKNLKSIEFEDENSDIQIGYNAFEACPIKSIHFPKNAKLFDEVLNDCRQLREIWIPKDYYDEDNDFQLLSEVIGKIEWDNPNLQIIPI